MDKQPLINNNQMDRVTFGHAIVIGKSQPGCHRYWRHVILSGAQRNEESLGIGLKFDLTGEVYECYEN